MKTRNVMNEKRAIAFAPCIAALALVARCAAAACSIALPESPTAEERAAAADLQDALRRMGSGDVQIVAESAACAPALFVGATRRAAAATNEAGVAAWRPDEVFLASVPEGVVLAGNPVRGVTYAVETYLEDFCGVRWWTSTESFYPRLPSPPVKGISMRHAPPFIFRETYYRDALDAEFKVRLKQNFASRTSVMNAEQHDIPPERGGSFRFPIFKGRKSAYHTFFVFVPPAVHFKDHPEWFGLVKGKREALQLCLTNKEMEDEFVASLKRTLAGDPGASFVQVSQMDQPGWCECADCTAVMERYGGLPSGLMIDFVNRVAARIEPEFPNVTLDTFAYQYTRRPPTGITVRSNVVVRLCTSGCAYNLPLAEHPGNKTFLEDLDGWAKAAPGRLFAWDYVTDFMSYIHPHPNWRAMPANIRLFADAGAVGAFLQGDILCPVGEFVGLRLWLQAHLLWNPRADDRALLDEYLRGYYGKGAAVHLREYIDLMTAAVADPKIRMSMYHEFSPWITKETSDKASAAMARAVAAAEAEGPEFARRARRERLTTEHLALANWSKYGDGSKSERQRRVVEWVRSVKEAGVQNLREFDGMRCEDYLRAMIFAGMAVAQEEPVFSGDVSRLSPNDSLGLTRIVGTNDFARIEMSGGGKGNPGACLATTVAIAAGDWLRVRARQTSRRGHMPFYVKTGRKTVCGNTYFIGPRFPRDMKWVETYVKAPEDVPAGGELRIFMQKPLWDWTIEIKSIDRVVFSSPVPVDI
jgi:hypothetical protein